MKTTIFLMFLILACTDDVRAQVAIIANSSVSESSVSAEQLLDICLLETRTWSNGKAIELMLLRDNSPEEKEFYEYLGRTPLEMRKVWLRAQLSGQARPPQQISSQEELLRRVETTPGAVGFVNRQKVRGKVKTLLLLE
jgi:hypothetical protein